MIKSNRAKSNRSKLVSRIYYENRKHLERKWLNDISENDKLHFSELYNYKLRIYLAKQKLLTLRKAARKGEAGLACHQKKKLPNAHARASNVVRSTYNQQKHTAEY